MTDVNTIELDAKSFKDLCKHVDEVENRNLFLEKAIKAVKLNNSRLSLERNSLQNEVDKLNTELRIIKNMTMFEFANTYCSEAELEDAGHELARSLGVGGH